MNLRSLCRGSIASALVTFLLATAGCGDSPPDAGTGTPPAGTSDAPRKPLVEKAQIGDWCPEHGVPESICTRCNAELTAGFKAKGDWCEKHGLPDSQCFTCHPELEAKFKAMAPKK